MKLKQLALATVLAPLAMAANAEITFTPMVGAHYFDSMTNDKLLGNGPNPENWQLRYGASLGYRFTDAFGVEVEGGRTESQTDVPANAQDIRVTQVTGNGYYTFNTNGSFQPYVLLGAGQQRFKVKGGGSSTDTIYNGGIGAFYRFTDTLALRGELRAVHNQDFSLTDGLALVGLEFSPSNPKPVVEAAPQPEPEQPVAPVVADDDGDGVANDLDKCPNTPAGMRVDASGCPIDSDGDGVPDSIDQCPNTPAGVQVDAKGCPLDQDGDGVPDYLDKCPNTPAGALVDAEGCPKVLTEAINREVKVLFDSGKAVIKPEFKSEVEEVSKLLRQYPTAFAEIQGYTDSSGSKVLNERLSQQRADAIRNSLVQDFGIDASRVSSKGFGPANPVADNKTAEGKAQNRRVIAVITGERKQIQMRKDAPKKK